MIATPPHATRVPPGLLDPAIGVWPFTDTIHAFDRSFELRTNSLDVLRRLRNYWPPHAAAGEGRADFIYSVIETHRDTAAGRPQYHAYSGEALFAATGDEVTLCDLFESTVRLDMASAASGWTFVHAGAVGWRGGAIVIPAPSMCGKSRLVQALVAAGATYYSDEFAVLDADGRVHPFQVPASIRLDSGGAVRVRLHDPDAPLPPPLPVTAVISMRFEKDAGWRLAPGTRAEAVMALLANSVRARLAPADVLGVLARAAEHTLMFQGPRGDADHVARLLLEEIR